MKFIQKIILLFICTAVLGSFTSCSDANNDADIDTSVNNDESDSDITSYTLDDLRLISDKLKENGYDISHETEKIIEDDSLQTKSLGVLVSSEKIVVTIPHPTEPNKTLDVSGVLLTPQNYLKRKTKKLVVCTAGTYNDNKGAPSNLYKNILKYISNIESGIGSAVYLFNAIYDPILIIDYPGFGASYKKIQHPYLDQKILAETSIPLIRAAQKKLKKNNIELTTSDITVTGYSQGAFAATAIVRAIETNSAYSDLEVASLLVGGTPASFSRIMDLAIERDHADVPYFLPYGLIGYSKVRYPDLDLKSIVKEPYLTYIQDDFKGDGIKYDYPQQISLMYDKYFMENYKVDKKFELLLSIFDENSLKPWKNKAKFTMTHDVEDTTVDYSQAYEYSVKHNEAGGYVQFIPSKCKAGHTLGFVSYWLKLGQELEGREVTDYCTDILSRSN